MKRICLALIAWVAAMGGAHAAGSRGEPFVAVGKTVTPEQVLMLVESHGAGGAVLLLEKSGAWRSSVLPGVTAAGADWLGVANALRPGADAGAGEELDYALSVALLKAPYSVLPILQKLWWKDEQTPPCAFGWDSELPGGVEQYVRRLKKELEKPPPAKVVELSDACVRGIEATLRDVNEHHGGRGE